MDSEINKWTVSKEAIDDRYTNLNLNGGSKESETPKNITDKGGHKCLNK